MTIFNFFQSDSTPKRILTSRPIFQSASSFLNDDDDLRKPIPPSLPFYRSEKIMDRHNNNDNHTKPRPKPKARLHLILHILSTVFTFISLILFIAAIPIWNANFKHTKSLVAGDYTDGVVLVPLFLSLLISLYILLTEHTPSNIRLYLRPRFKSSTTSLTNVQSSTLTLLALTSLLTLAPTLTLSATSSLALAWRSPTRTKNGLVICNLTNIFSRPCQPILYQVGSLQIAGIVAGGLAWCVWLVVLAVALRDWARERTERKRLAARERRRRRHERRRGHGTSNGQGQESGRSRRHEQVGREARHKLGREGGVETSSKGGKSNGLGRTEHGYRGQNSPIGHYLHDPSPDNTAKEIQRGVRSTDARIGSAAVHQVSRQVRPKETIQVWLNGR